MQQDPSMATGSKARDELESKMHVLKQLEGVLKTSSDPEQKKRVARDIKEIKQSIANLQNILSVQKKYGLVDEVYETEGEEIFKVLNRISVSKFQRGSRDTEMDSIISYVDFFEKNYLPVLSEYYMKLDYNHSMKRDTFYPRYMEMKKIMNEYIYEVEVQSREEYNKIAVYKDKSIIYKLRQQYLMSLDRYYKDLRAFFEDLLEDHSSGGSVVMNPLDLINMSEFEVDRKLDGYTVINSIVEIHSFCKEIIQFLAIPNI
jgi:hypothetical protein